MMRSIRRPLWAAAAAAGLMGCEPTSRRATQQHAGAGEFAAQALGCYALYAGGGRADAALRAVSPGVRLDSAAAAGYEIDDHVERDRAPRPAVRRARRLDADGRALPAAGGELARAYPVWWMDPRTDSLHVAFLAALGTTQLVLAPAGARWGDTLRGRAFDTTAYGPPFQTARRAVHAVRQPCRESATAG